MQELQQEQDIPIEEQLLFGVNKTPFSKIILGRLMKANSIDLAKRYILQYFCHIGPVKKYLFWRPNMKTLCKVSGGFEICDFKDVHSYLPDSPVKGKFSAWKWFEYECHQIFYITCDMFKPPVFEEDGELFVNFCGGQNK
mgnify:CR=1 FL=1